MRLKEYLDFTAEAAAHCEDGKLVYVIGGLFGVEWPIDNGFAVLAYDNGDESGWHIWRETIDGEQCCEGHTEELGQVPLEDLQLTAMRALSKHRHSRL